MKQWIVAIAFAGLSACSSGSQESASQAGADMALAKMEAAAPIEGEASPNPLDSVTTGRATIPQKIIKTADVRFRVESLKNADLEVHRNVKEVGGQIVVSNQSNQNGMFEQSFTIRVPVQHFDKLLNQLSTEAIYMDYKNIRAEDVTAEFVDTEARTKAKKAVEKRYLEILKQAKNVEEIIAVEAKLAEIREEIEAKEGRLNYLRDQVAHSTVNLTIYEQTALSEHPQQPFYKRIWQNLVQGFVIFFELIIAFFYLIPFVIIIGVVVYLVRKKWLSPKA